MPSWPQDFLIGSDAVCPAERLDTWDRGDTGWERIAELLAFHRGWKQRLPAPVARAPLHDNAHAPFRPDAKRPRNDGP